MIYIYIYRYIYMYVCVYSYLSLQHTQFGSSMRSLALLRFGGCEDFLKSVRAVSRLCFGIYVFDCFCSLLVLPAFLVGLEFSYSVSSIGNWIMLAFALLKFGDMTCCLEVWT